MSYVLSHWELVTIFLIFGGSWFTAWCYMPRQDAHAAQRWMPVVVLLLFMCGVATTTSVSRAQSPMSFDNAVKIGELERKVSELNDMPSQMAAIHERQSIMEATLKTQGNDLASINSMGHWLVFGVFGILGTQIMQRFRWVGLRGELPVRNEMANTNVNNREDN